MQKNLIISLKLTVVLVLLCAVIYPLFIALIAKTAPGEGKGVTISVNGKVVGFERIGQKFTSDKYFQGRPSAVGYNAAGSGGSNKGPSNNEYLQTVKDRIDSFLLHNPGIQKNEIPADLITASGSGLDPDISPAGALVQVKRVANARGLKEELVKALVEKQIEKNMFGPSVINVLKLNVALDQLR
jgi:K+-transporting ATPase ATPase C chain